MPTDYFMRVGNGDHYRSSSKFGTWGITSTHSHAKMFMRNAVAGDRIWFLQKGGKILAVATFVSTNSRELGPLIQLTRTNEELGWTKTTGNWDTEVHYTNLYDLEKCDMMTRPQGQSGILRFNLEKCGINLPEEYLHIVRYSNAVRK
jgi:hypothetical protein